MNNQLTKNTLYHPIKNLIKNVLDNFDFVYNCPESVVLPSDLKKLNKLMGNIHPSQLVVVASRPSMGKSAFVQRTAINVAKRRYYDQLQSKASDVLIYSLQMNAEELATQLVSSHCKINQNLLRTGELEPSELSNLTSGVGALRNYNILINDPVTLSPQDIEDHLKYLKLKQDIDLVVIDGLQLMYHKTSTENDHDPFPAIARQLKKLAKEYNITIIVTSDLDPTIEHRADKRPVLSDLTRAGNIESVADTIIFLYRDELYNPDSEDKGLIEIIIGKNRFGPLGTVKLKFLPEYSLFLDESNNDMDYPFDEDMSY